MSNPSGWYLRRRPVYLEGHEVRLLRGGDALFPALVDAIERARFEVWLATYIFHTDEAAQAVAQALTRAAQRGIRVRVVVDGFGSIGSVAALGEQGLRPPVALAVYRPLDRWWAWLQPEHLRRLHQKLCVVDGEIAFVGGINIIDDRLDLHHGRLSAPRLDFAVAVRGPVVTLIEHTARAMWTRAAFGADWRDEISALLRQRQGLKKARELMRTMRLTSRPLGQLHAARVPPGASMPAVHPPPPAGHRNEPPPAGDHSEVPPAGDRTEPSEAGPVAAAFLLRDNLRQRHSILAVLLQACAAARHRIDIVCPYFYPGGSLRRALTAAARRGVQVRLLLQGRPDYRIAAMAASVLYRELLQAGVRVFEYTPSFLHAKVVQVDEHWATVGSSNLDPLSLLVNFEANLAVRDGPFVQDLQRELDEAFAQSHEITAPPQGSLWGGMLRRHLIALIARLYLRLAGERAPY